MINRIKRGKVLLVDPAPSPSSLPEEDLIVRSMKERAMGVVDSTIAKSLELPLGPSNDKYAVSLGLLSIAGLLEKAGIECAYLNEAYERECGATDGDLSSIFARMPLVMVTAYTNSYTSALRILWQSREANPACYVVIGGPHATFTVGSCLRDGFNAVVAGEGEMAARDIALAVLSGQRTLESRGVHTAASVSSNRCEQTVVCDLNELPTPAYHLVPEEMRKDCQPRVYSSRGCGRRCAFCVEGRFWGGTRQRAGVKVVEDIRVALEHFGRRLIVFVDSSFGRSDADWDLVEKLTEAQLGVPFACQMSLADVAVAPLHKLSAAGFVGVFIGMETGASDILRRVRKDCINLDMIHAALERAKDAFRYVYTSWILGLPGETPQTAFDTIRTIDRLHASRLILDSRPRLFVPYPGSEIAEDPGGYGISILHQEWPRYGRLCFPPASCPQGLSPMELWMWLRLAYMTGLKHICSYAGMSSEFEQALGSLPSGTYCGHHSQYRTIT